MNRLLNSVILLLMTLCLPVYATNLKVGDDAPNFNLQATDGKFYNLNDYFEKKAVVLAWYPMANTRGCTFECKSLIDKGHLIREYNVSYFMASVDPLEDNIEFAKQTGADFPMLSDSSKQVAKAYDVLNLFKVANRVTFYISKQGKILHIDENISPKTAAEDIANQLKLLAIEQVKPLSKNLKSSL